MLFHSDGMDVQIDDSDGSIVKISNLITEKDYLVEKDECFIELEQGKISFSDVAMALTGQDDNSCVFVGSQGGLEITIKYTFPAGRDYFDRSLSVKNLSDSESLVIKNIGGVSLGFAKAFESTLYHNDGMDKLAPGDMSYHPDYQADGPIIYQGALNVFMRDTDGGLLVGLKYPHFTHELANDSVSLSYEANYRLGPNEAIDLPTMFCGTYEKTGYTCRKELHWTPRVLSTAQEEMDWGEVWAMQKVLRDYLPQYDCPKDGYFVWLNSWWAKPALRGKIGEAEVKAYAELADEAKMAGCVDMLGTAPTWVGWVGYIEPAPAIAAIGDDAVFPMNPYIQQFLDNTKAVGLDVFSFCEPSGVVRDYRKDRPDWKIQPTEDPASTIKLNCQANDSYADWFYRLNCNVIDSCGLNGWAWDFCWVRRPMICHNSEHGHETGNCEFQQYRNVTGLVQKLRQRYPRHLLEVFWGLKEESSWGHRGLNGMESIYENGDPKPPPDMGLGDDLRFQHWYNHNYRFLPTYMNMSQINFGKEANGHLYSLMSALNASAHGQLADWVEFSSQEEADKLFAPLNKWKAWATENIEYLRDRVDLFGQPCRKGGIDGTAHIISDRGFIFAFNPWPEEKWGSIALNDLIRLEAGERFSLDDISGEKSVRLGVCDKGEEFVFSIAGKSAMLIELKPTSDELAGVEAPADAEIQPAFRK